MKLGTSLVAHGPGILPLQVHNPEWNLGLRPALYAWRVTGRRDQLDQEGQWIIDPDTVGYVFGGHNWPALGAKLDKVASGWNFAWPAIVTTGGDTIATGTSRCGVGLDAAVLPQYWAGLADDRFAPFTLPPGGQRHPSGTLGIMLAGTSENNQENVFLATDRRLVAANRFGGTALSSQVHDLTDKAAYGISAALHSAWYVAQPRGGKPRYGANVLAWQIGGSGCSDDAPGFGFVHDRSKKTLAVMGRVHFGPFEVGVAGGDKHEITKTEDGEPTNSGHLSTETYFFRTQRQDAPLNFDSPDYVPASDPPHYVKAFLRYNPALLHRHFDAVKEGRWDLEAKCWFTAPDVPCRVPPSIPTPGSPAGGVPILPLPDLRDSPTTDVQGKTIANLNVPYDAGMGQLPVGVATTTMGFLAQAWFPQAVVTSQVDFTANMSPTREQLCALFDETPCVVNVAAIGNEGGVTVSASLTAGGGVEA